MVNSIAMGKQLYRELPPDRPRGYVSRKLLSWLIRAALVVAFFAVANVALVGIQHLIHRSDYAELKSLKADMSAKNIAINSEEAQLQSLQGEVKADETRLGQLGPEIDKIETKNPDGIPPEIYKNYTSMVNTFNSIVGKHNRELAEYKALYTKYSTDVSGYNVSVQTANTLIKKIGPTWYIIPIPAGRFSSRDRISNVK